MCWNVVSSIGKSGLSVLTYVYNKLTLLGFQCQLFDMTVLEDTYCMANPVAKCYPIVFQKGIN